MHFAGGDAHPLQLQEVRSEIGVVQHSVLLSNSPGIDGYSLTIHNKVDITSQSNKVSIYIHTYVYTAMLFMFIMYTLYTQETAMRLKSSIVNDLETFYTDLNGFQMTKRRTYSKIPLQGNFYPMPTSAVLQDNKNRLSLFTGQPLGVGSLKQGQCLCV